MIDLPYFGKEAVYVYGANAYRRKAEYYQILQLSIDGGANWSNLYTFDSDIRNIVQTANGNILVALDPDSYWSETHKGKWYVSTDGGVTFSLTLTYSSGGINYFSFDVKENEVVVGEYGTYDAPYVYYSSDGGVNWTTIFTHPDIATGNVHIHKVLFDQYLGDTIYVSNGDLAPKSVWWTQDNGSNWGRIPHHQPTWMEADVDYLYLFGDTTGIIHRILKTDIFAGTYNQSQTIVYDASQDPEGDYAPVSFYGGRRCGSFILTGGIGYGETDSVNNKDGSLLVSWNQGDDWRVVKNYPKKVGSMASGPFYISNPLPNGKCFIHSHDNDTTEILDTTRSDFIALLTPLARRGSTLTIKTS